MFAQPHSHSRTTEFVCPQPRRHCPNSHAHCALHLFSVRGPAVSADLFLGILERLPNNEDRCKGFRTHLNFLLKCTQLKILWRRKNLSAGKCRRCREPRRWGLFFSFFSFFILFILIQAGIFSLYPCSMSTHRRFLTNGQQHATYKLSRAPPPVHPRKTV